MATARGSDLVVADVLEGVGDDGDAHVDQIGRGHLEDLAAELFAVLVDLLPKSTQNQTDKEKKHKKTINDGLGFVGQTIIGLRNTRTTTTTRYYTYLAWFYIT